MDTQIKVTIEKVQYKKDEIIESKSISFDPKSNDNEVIFSFFESDNVFVNFEFNSDVIGITMETYNTDVIEIMPGVRSNISQGQEDADSYYVGKYALQIVLDNKKYTKFFEVHPKNLNTGSVFEMRKYVNDFYNGLTLDLNKEKKFLIADQQLKNRMQGNVYNKYIFILNNMPKVLNLTSQIIAARNEDTVKISRLSHSPGKFNKKSIEWLAKKGMTKNENINNPSTVLISKTSIKIDNYQNQYFKMNLEFWNGEITRILHSLKMIKNDFDSQLIDKRAELENCKIKYNEIQNVHSISDKRKKELKSRIKRLSIEVQEQNDFNLLIKNNVNDLIHFKMSLEYYLHNSWLSRVSGYKRNGGLLLNSRLKVVDDIRKAYLSKATLSQGEDGVISFSEKSTPRLFETFVYIMLINILKEVGYSLAENFYEESNNIIFKLSNPSVIQMIGESGNCNIIYDNEVKCQSKELEDEYCSINSFHNRPDFILSFTNCDGRLEKAIVVEVKWRNIRQIYNEKEDTNVTLALRDYLSFAYKEKGKKRLNRAVIDEVIVVYPDSRENVVNILDEDIIGVGLNPKSDFVNSEGYNNIKNEILNILEIE